MHSDYYKSDLFGAGRPKSGVVDMAALTASKAALRREIKNKLSALTVEEVERQSKRVQEKVGKQF